MGKHGGAYNVDPERIKPRGALVLARKRKENMTEGGIALPDVASDQGDSIVVAVGPDAPGDLAVGTRVLHAHFGGVAISCDNGQELRLLKDEEILAVIDG